MGGNVSAQPTAPLSPTSKPQAQPPSSPTAAPAVDPALTHAQYSQALLAHTSLSTDVIAVVLSYLRPLPVVVCLGGHDGSKRLLSMDVYDPNTSLWAAPYSFFPPLPFRTGFYTKLSAVVRTDTHHHMYVMSDLQRPATNSALRYDVWARKWETVPGFVQYRKFPTANSLEGRGCIASSPFPFPLHCSEA
jgi:hypothetical protein